MMNHKKFEYKIEGEDNFQEYKYIISLILEDNDLDKYINEEVPEPEGEEEKENDNKNMIRDKRIIEDSVKDKITLMYHH